MIYILNILNTFDIYIYIYILMYEYLWIRTFTQRLEIALFEKLGFSQCKAEQPLWGMELQENEAQKDYSIQEICLERTYS